MATYLLTWNPQKWNWETLPEELEQVRSGQLLPRKWSTGQRKNISINDRIFLIKQGDEEPKGIMASGRVVSESFRAEHFSRPDEEANYVSLEFDVLLDPYSEEILPRCLLNEEPFNSCHWDMLGGGNEIPPDISTVLEQHWREYTQETDEARDLVQSQSEAALTQTEREARCTTRIGQTRFRQRVCQREPRCRVTGVTNNSSYYRVASHIKPWSHSNSQERLDGNNGLLLAPHIDLLFDKGLISFENDGTLLISSRADIESLRLMGVPVDESFNAGDFSQQQQHYLKYHRDRIFQR